MLKVNRGNSQLRSIAFRSYEQNRYWWFRHSGANYIPPVFGFLKQDEWYIIENWYRDSEKLYPAGTGECAIPAISMLFGFITGNNVSRIVQLGHYIGFSTLLIGFMLRYMGIKKGLFSIDIDSEATKYTQRWILRAGLQDYIQLFMSDSSDPAAIAKAVNYLGGRPQLVFLDSSHQYQHTVKELDCWFDNMADYGAIFLHDTSAYAAGFDSTKQGGVQRAMREWLQGKSPEAIMLNAFCDGTQDIENLIYKDGCGLGIIQKQHPRPSRLPVNALNEPTGKLIMDGWTLPFAQEGWEKVPHEALRYISALQRTITEQARDLDLIKIERDHLKEGIAKLDSFINLPLVKRETRCRFCGASPLYRSFSYPDKNNVLTDIFSCRICGAHVPDYDLDSGRKSILELQTEYIETVWPEMTPEESSKLLEDLLVLVDYYEAYIAPPSEDEIVVEIGAGRGGLVKALLDRGHRVIACEPSRQLVALAGKAYGISDRELRCCDAIDFMPELTQWKGKIKAVFMWHVLEHMNEPLGLLRSIGELLTEDGAIIAQIPLFSQEHLYKQHLFFLNEPAVAYAARECGLVSVAMNYDPAYKYMGFVLQRQKSSQCSAS